MQCTQLPALLWGANPLPPPNAPLLTVREERNVIHGNVKLSSSLTILLELLLDQWRICHACPVEWQCFPAFS